MKLAIIFSSILFLSLAATAQKTESMETDRPDQSESAFTVPLHWFQMEAGFSRMRFRDGSTTLLRPSILNRYGVSKKIELRLLLEYETQRNFLGTSNAEVSVGGLAPIELGTKIRLWKENGSWPQTALMLQTSIPNLASTSLQAERWAPEVRLAMQNTITERLGLSYNLGAEWNDESDHPFYIYTLAPQWQLGEKWNTYVELFGFLNRDNHPQHSLDGGFVYAVSNNSQLDISVGAGLTPNTRLKHYVALGFSWRAGKSAAAKHSSAAMKR